MKAIDLVGQRFNRLLVVKLEKITNYKRRWLCLCDCGKIASVQGDKLRNGRQQSCGCLHLERITSHGMSRSSTYRCWMNMIQRCVNPLSTGYRYYGGRGITVCERWRYIFENFLADMGKQPGPRMSVDRIDVNGNYEPANCRWLSMAKQQLNRRDNRRITYRGITKPVNEWCADLKVSPNQFHGRARLGWPIEKIFDTPFKVKFKRKSLSPHS